MFQNVVLLSSSLLGMSSDAMPDPPRMPGGRDLRKARQPRRRGLSVEAIVDVAMAIVDSEGLDALTMRAVAAELGTGAASLYAYVGSKDELITLLIDRVLGEMEFEGEPDPARWREQFKAMAVATRQAWGRHRDLVRAQFARVPLGGQNALDGSEWMIAVLRAGGLSDRTVGLALDLVALYIGAVAYEDSLDDRAGLSPEQWEEFAASLRNYFTALPAERYPNLVSMAVAISAVEDRFEFGLDVILAGLAALDATASAG
jgi:AcrR family transcriptional regulator